MGLSRPGEKASHRALPHPAERCRDRCKDMPVKTYPIGHVLLGDAFEIAWSQIEDAERYTADAAERSLSNGDDASLEAWRGYDASRERVEAPMRAALASGALRAFVRDSQTGEAVVLGDRHLWDRHDRTFRGLGLGDIPNEVVNHGPYTGNRPVFVQEKELRAFITSQKKEAMPKEKPDRKRSPTSAEKLACLAAHNGVLKGFRETREWFKENAPECSRRGVDAFHRGHTGSRRPGPSNR